MGFVANFIRFPAVQKFENWLRFAKVTDNLKVVTFSETQCIDLASWCVNDSNCDKPGIIRTRSLVIQD